MKTKTILLFLMLTGSILNGQGTGANLLAYAKQGEKIGFIDINGSEIIPALYDDVRWFSEGLIAVNKGAVKENYEKKGGKWGYLDAGGRSAIALKYEDAKDFQEGLAPVRMGGKYGYINARDETRIGFRYGDANPFSEELAAVRIGEKWGFINRRGEMVIDPAFHRAGPFQHGLSIVFHQTRAFEVAALQISEPSIPGRWCFPDQRKPAQSNEAGQ